MLSVRSNGASRRFRSHRTTTPCFTTRPAHWQYSVKLIAPLMRLNWRLTPVAPGETAFRAILTGSAFEITRAFRLWQSGFRVPNRGLMVSLALTDFANSFGGRAEVMMLTNSAADWRIRSIHFFESRKQERTKEMIYTCPIPHFTGHGEATIRRPRNTISPRFPRIVSC